MKLLILIKANFQQHFNPTKLANANPFFLIRALQSLHKSYLPNMLLKHTRLSTRRIQKFNRKYNLTLLKYTPMDYTRS